MILAGRSLFQPQDVNKSADSPVSFSTAKSLRLKHSNWLNGIPHVRPTTTNVAVVMLSPSQLIVYILSLSNTNYLRANPPIHSINILTGATDGPFSSTRKV